MPRGLSWRSASAMTISSADGAVPSMASFRAVQLCPRMDIPASFSSTPYTAQYCAKLCGRAFGPAAVALLLLRKGPRPLPPCLFPILLAIHNGVGVRVGGLHDLVVGPVGAMSLNCVSDPMLASTYSLSALRPSIRFTMVVTSARVMVLFGRKVPSA